MLQRSLLGNGVGVHDDVREGFPEKHSAEKNEMKMLIKDSNALLPYLPLPPRGLKEIVDQFLSTHRACTHCTLPLILNPKDADSASGPEPERRILNSECATVFSTITT